MKYHSACSIRKILIFLSCSIICTVMLHGEPGNPDYRLVNAKGGLRVRAAPDKTSAILTTIPRNIYVQVIEKTDHTEVIDKKKGYWVKVRFGTHEGYLFSGYLEHKKWSSKDIVKSAILAAEPQINTKSLTISGNKDLYIAVYNNPEISEAMQDRDTKITSLWSINDGSPKPLIIRKNVYYAKITFVNNDTYADFIYSEGCCGQGAYMAILSNSDGTYGEPKPIVENSEDMWEFSAEGKCESTKLTSDKESHYFVFSCVENKFIKK